MILDEAKEKIYKSSIVKYVSKEKIEEAFKRIHIYENEEEFYKIYGKPKEEGDFLEGFNRSEGSHIGPNATPHTIIHEVLHFLSSEFDKNGHRINNGLMGDVKFGNFANQVNEGITDFLACKISGEKPRHYLRGNKIFESLEPEIQRFYEDDNILFQLYLEHNDLEFKKFLNFSLSKSGGSKEFYDNFLFYSDKKIEKMKKEMNKSVKKEKGFFKKIIKKFKSIFQKKDIKYLNSGSENNQFINATDKHKKFLEAYSISNEEPIRKNEESQTKNNSEIERDDDEYSL